MKSISFMRRALGVRFIIISLVLLFCLTTKGEVVSADLKMAEITDSELLSFLKEYIVPLAKNNHYDYTKDCITLDDGKKYDKTAKSLDNTITITITTRGNGHNTLANIYYDIVENKAQFYVVEVEGVKMFIEYNGYNNDWFRPLKSKKLSTKFEYPKNSLELISFNDDSVTWKFSIGNGAFRLINFLDYGFSWFEDSDYFKKAPALPVRQYKAELPDVLGLRTSEKPK